MNTANVSLKVPFNEKDQAKALGARWNAEAKQWYVPQGVDSAAFSQWFTDTPSAPVNNTQPKSMSKVVASSSANEQSFDGDMDAINARLRDAFEFREQSDM